MSYTAGRFSFQLPTVKKMLCSDASFSPLADFAEPRHFDFFCHAFPWARLRANSCALQLRGFCFLGSSPNSMGPSQYAAARFGSSSPRFLVPQENGARKRRFKNELYNRSEEHTSELQSQSNLVCRL